MRLLPNGASKKDKPSVHSTPSLLTLMQLILKDRGGKVKED